jgi:hypothetical protein
MFVDDIKSLRTFFIKNLNLSLNRAKNSEDLRAQERTYFMAELEKNAKTKETMD